MSDTPNQNNEPNTSSYYNQLFPEEKNKKLDFYKIFSDKTEDQEELERKRQLLDGQSSEIEDEVWESLQRSYEKKKYGESAVDWDDPEVERKIYQGAEDSPGKLIRYFNFSFFEPKGDKLVGFKEVNVKTFDVKKESSWNSEEMQFSEDKFFVKIQDEYSEINKEDLPVVHEKFLESSLLFPYYQNGNDTFAMNLKDLRDYVSLLEKLFSKFQQEKEKEDSQYDDIKYMPEFTFDGMLRDFKILVKEIENYLYSCMNKNVVKDFYTVEKNDRNVKIPYYYFSGEKYKKREIRERVENAVFTVVVIPKVNFITRMKFTKTGSEEDEYKETVTDWPEITSFYIRTFEDEKEFNREQYPEDELSDYVTVYRPFFTGNYSSLKEKMKIPYVRYILGNYGRLKEYLAKKKKITWREFLSYFIRPPIRYSYIKLNGDRATQEELSILKTPKQAAQEREAAERNKASKLNPQKTEEIDSGKLQKIEDKINSLNPEDVHAVVKKFRLESLARLALRCALEYADLPSVEIPKINLPSFDYKYDLQVKDPSGGMFNKLLEDLRTISFKTVLKQMKKFFSVEDCKDFKKFTQKKSWENFFVRLKEALIKDFNNYIEKIKNDLMELDEILSKTLCDPEVFVMSLYTSGVCLTPPETEQLLMGNLNTSKMVDFTNHVNRVSFMLGCENNYLLPEDVSVVFSTISRHFDKNIMPSYITPEEEEQEIYTETKIRCESAFDLYLNWLKDNGVTPEVIECLRETNTQEKSQIIEELYAYAEANGITELEKPIIVEDESSRKFLRNVFDVSVGKYLNNMATYVDLFSVFAGSKIAPSDFEDARQNLLNSFTLSSMKIEGASEETNNALKDNYLSTMQKMRDLMDKSEVVSGAFTPYNVGENVISRGDVFWDLRYAYNTNAYKQVFSFTPMGYQFLLSLKNGEEVKITGSRQTAGLYYQSRTVTIGEKSYTSTFETPLIQKNKDLYEEIPNYRKKFSDLLWKDLPVAFNNPQVYGYFDHIFEKELYNFIQKKIADVFIEEMFRKSPIMCPFHLDGSNNATYGVELFLSFFRELTNIQGEENKEYLFLVDDWFERFYSLVMKDYKYSGVYKVEEHLKKILFRLKGRFYSFLFRLSTLPIVRFSKTDSNHFLVHYLLNTYPNFISEFLEEEEEHDFFKNLEMSNKIDEMFSGESSPIAEDLKFFLKNSLLSPTDNIGENAKREILKNEIPNNSGLYSSEPNYTMLEAQEVVKEEFQKASEMMSASLNKGAPISPVGGFLRSLRIRHFDGRVNYIVPSNIEQYYNNFSSQYSKFDLFLEAFYVDSDGETRNFALVSGGRRYSKDSNLYVQYNNKPMVYTTFMFDEEKMQKVPKFYFALSFAKYFVEPDNFFFGRDRFDIEYIIPILKVEVNPIEFYEFWVKNGNFSYDDKQKEEFLFDYLIKKLENDLYVQLYLRIVLGLDEIFDYCNIFLFEIMKKTTDISVLFDVKYDLPVPEESEEKALEQEIKEIEKYDNNSDLRSDAFGLLRRSLASSTIQKMALSMAEDTPKMIFKAFVEMTDKNIAAARYIVDNNRFGPPEKRKKLDIRFVSLVLLLPSNLWPPPYGIGPPITPLGMMYLAIEDKLKPNKKKKEENKENVEQILQNVEDVVNEEELYYLNILREVCYNCFCYKEEDKEEIIDQVEKSCFV